jgi:hypothetical protein
LTYFGTHGPSPKAEKPVKDKLHLAFVASLGCVLTGLMDVAVHHLLKAPSRHGQHKAGDQHTVALRKDLHVALHDVWGDEAAFFTHHGVPEYLELANGIYANSGDRPVCMKLIAKARAPKE